ncbi:MAG: papain-like cysteine peptidase, partial [Lachnospiraceae bacterium]|nr:papain-like cysteine peptidase [Lachnospiraceae bacterium]
MFSQFISLGSNCRVAASMAKYGFRSWSRQFDWLITYNLEWVLHFIENDFLDFLQIENLESHQGKETQFFDKRSGFYFLHDQE